MSGLFNLSLKSIASLLTANVNPDANTAVVDDVINYFSFAHARRQRIAEVASEV